VELALVALFACNAMSDSGRHADVVFGIALLPGDRGGSPSPTGSGTRPFLRELSASNSPANRIHPTS
jgi:hypothetical protein